MIHTRLRPGIHDFASALGGDGAFTTYEGSGSEAGEAWPRPNGVAGPEKHPPEQQLPLVVGTSAVKTEAMMMNVAESERR